MPYFIKQTNGSPLNGLEVSYSSEPFFADLDGDGKIDLLVGTESGEFQAYRNTDSGYSLFDRDFVGLTDKSFGNITSANFADIDGDGDDDAVIQLENGEIQILQNKAGSFLLFGEGSLDLISNQSFRQRFFEFESFVTSLDLQSTVAVNQAEITTTVASETQQSEQPSEEPTGGSQSNSESILEDVLYVDIDGDGDDDKLVEKDDQTFDIYRNNDGIYVLEETFDSIQVPTSTFAERVGQESTVEEETVRPVTKTALQPRFSDLDGDGDLDAVVGYSNGDIEIYLNQDGESVLTATLENVGQDARPALGDVDSDGDLDILIGDRAGRLHYYQNKEDEGFVRQTGKKNPVQYVDVGYDARPTFADIDGDGDPDLVVSGQKLDSEGNPETELHHFDNFTATPSLSNLGGHSLTSFSVESRWDSFNRVPRQLADVNGDGRADIVGFGSSKVYLSLGQEDGTFEEPTVATGSFTSRSGWDSFDRVPRQLADVNGDGRADIVGFGSSKVYIALGQEDGTFGQSTVASSSFTNRSGWDRFDRVPRQLADVNGDGRADIVGFGSSKVYVALGQEDGTFGNSAVATSSFTSRSGWDSFDRVPRQLADVNGDGRADIVGFGSSKVYVALGQEDGTFGNSAVASGSFTHRSGWTSFDKYPRQLADMNGDGMADIVGFGSSEVYVALGRTNGTFGEATKLTNYYTHQYWGWTSQDEFPRQLGDVNGDGLADVVGFGDRRTLTTRNNTVRPDPAADLFFESVFTSNDKSLWHNGDAFEYNWKFNESIEIPKFGNDSYSFGFAKVNSGGLGSSREDGPGKIGFGTGIEIEGGTINTDLPLITWFGMPGQIPTLGNTTTLKTGSLLSEDATFETIFPYVSAFLEVDVDAAFSTPEISFDVPLINQEFTYSPDLLYGGLLNGGLPSPDLPNPDLPNYSIQVDEKLRVSFDTREGISSQGIPSDELTLLMEVGEGEEKQQKKAKKKKKKKGGFSLSDYLSFEIESINDMNLVSLREDDFTLIASNSQPFFQTRIDIDNILSDTTRLPDLEYGASFNYGVGSAFAEINLFDVDLVADFTLKQDIKLEVDRVDGRLTFEDGSFQDFQVGDDVDILLAGHKVDTNNDGHADIDVTVTPQVTLHNQTSMLYDLNVDFAALSGAAGFDVELDLGLFNVSLDEEISLGPVWSHSMDLQELVETYYQHTLPGLIEENTNLGIDLPTESVTDLLSDGSISIYNNSFALGGFGSQSYEFTIAV